MVSTNKPDMLDILTDLSCNHTPCTENFGLSRVMIPHINMDKLALKSLCYDDSTTESIMNNYATMTP